jgi:predicted anti-sigma-YlaC factor YlaD
VKFVEHASEDDLESSAMRSLPAPESYRLEEHVLSCSECRDRHQFWSLCAPSAGTLEGLAW